VVHERSFSTEPNRVLEVGYRGGEVRVSVWYGTNVSPDDSGFGAIPGVGLDPRVRGFPVIRAQVESSRSGYENMFGWIQGIAHLRPDGSLEDWGPDSLPSLRGKDVPFAFLGYNPAFYDAPFWPDRPQLHWRADLFLGPLTYRPSNEEPLAPLLGLRWGFRIPSEGADPIVLPLEEAGVAAWEEARAGLRSSFPSWRFGDWPVRPPT
jgi:hypothetical protein